MQDQQAVEEAQAQLLRRIAAQDRQALGEFYDQTAASFFSTAFRILGDMHEAEEVVQDVFVQIWNRASTFDGALGTPFHWGLGIARNRSIDRLRSRQRRSRILEEMVEQTATEPDPPPDNQFTLNEEEVTQVRQALKDLPLDQRQAIEMAFFGGMTHAEIATHLSEPLGTIKARIRRGMLKLREILQAYV
jgi:RNA polymerase sigma-70 factor (ECF subfamily)